MSPARMEKVEAAIRAAIEFHRALECGDRDALEAVLSADCVWEPAEYGPGDRRVVGRQAVIDRLNPRASLPAVSPSPRFRVTQVSGLGNRCIVFGELSLMNGGAETGETTVPAVDIISVRTGRIIEILSYTKK